MAFLALLLCGLGALAVPSELQEALHAEQCEGLVALQRRASQVGTVGPEAVRIVGRHRLSPRGAEFDFPAVKIMAGISNSTWASAVMQQVGDDKDAYVPNAFAVYVDGKFSSSFNTTDWFQKENVRITLFSGLKPEAHDVVIVKLTEPQFNAKRITPNYVIFSGLEGAEAMMVIQPPAPQRKIEFLGDSITAGDCNLCKPDPVNATPTWDNQDQRLAWPSLICNALDAECHVEAWSGFGLTLGCCKQPMSASKPMSKVWFRSLASDQSLNIFDVDGTPSANLWNFAAWKPDALVINLGTNDVMGGWPWITKTFNASYVALIEQAVEIYGLSTQFFLACGPMTHKHCESVKWVVEHAAASFKDLKISYLDQTHFLNGSYGPRCCYHPSAEVHSAMAVAGAEFIGKAMGWQDISVKV